MLKTIQKKIHDITEHMQSEHDKAVAALIVLDREVYKGDTRKLIRVKEQQMADAVKMLDFESAALLRDEIKTLQGKK